MELVMKLVMDPVSCITINEICNKCCNNKKKNIKTW